MRIRAVAYGACFPIATLPPLPAMATAPAPTEDFYLNECLGSGFDLALCQCVGQVFAPAKDQRTDVLSALMQGFVLRGDPDIEFSNVKQALQLAKVSATDAEIRRAIAVARAAIDKCQQ